MNNYDPGIVPNWVFFPWMGKLKDAVGGWQATALVFVVAALIMSALLLSFGNWWDHGRSTEKGKGGIVHGLVAAAIIGGASALIEWFASAGFFG